MEIIENLDVRQVCLLAIFLHHLPLAAIHEANRSLAEEAGMSAAEMSAEMLEVFEKLDEIVHVCADQIRKVRSQPN